MGGTTGRYKDEEKDELATRDEPKSLDPISSPSVSPSSPGGGAYAGWTGLSNPWRTSTADAIQTLLWPDRTFYCHLPPNTKRPGLRVIESALVSQMSQTISQLSSPPQVSVSASLTCTGVTLLCQSLVDSGADDNLIEVELVNELQIPLEPLVKPQKANALDGRLIATVTHQTESVSLVISSNHHEKIQLHMLPSPISPVVLGLPYLKLHKPKKSKSIQCSAGLP